MGIWAGIKHAVNSTLGTSNFKPLDQLIESEIRKIQYFPQTLQGKFGYSADGETTDVLNVSGKGRVNLFAFYTAKDDCKFSVSYTIDGKNLQVYSAYVEDGGAELYVTIPGFSFASSALIQVTADSGRNSSGIYGGYYLVNYEIV